jgi:hypothetical protein
MSGNRDVKRFVHSFHPNPNPIKERANILLRETIIRKLQPPLSLLACCLDCIAQIIRSFRTPLPKIKSMFADLVPQD